MEPYTWNLAQQAPRGASISFLSLAQDTQADESDLLLIFRQDRLARERRRLPRRSWRLEHNQCHSLYLFPAFPLSRKAISQKTILAPRSPVVTLSRFLNKDWNNRSSKT
jgi:hypothetical protein